MNMAARFFVFIFIVIAIPLVMALFIRRDYRIERSVVIHKPKEMVFDYVRLLKHQDDYSKWVMTDQKMKKWYKGTDGTEGFIYGWKGNSEAGEGEQEITKITPGEKIDIEVRFLRPFKSIAYTPISLYESAKGETSIKWECMGTNSYPYNFMNLFIDRMLGSELDQSLNNLKAILEK